MQQVLQDRLRHGKGGNRTGQVDSQELFQVLRPILRYFTQPQKL